MEGGVSSALRGHETDQETKRGQLRASGTALRAVVDRRSMEEVSEQEGEGVKRVAKGRQRRGRR